MKKLLLIILLLVPMPVLAYHTETQDGATIRNTFVIGPGKQTFTANPGQALSGEVQITSLFENKYQYSITVEDLYSSSDKEVSGDWVNKYSAKSWIKPEVGTIELNLGEKAFINYTIKVPSQADVGDHYAVVCGVENNEVGQENKETKKSEPTVTIQASSCQVVTVTIPGDNIQSGYLESFKTHKTWYDATPITFEILFKNEGTTTLAPTGTINISGWLGQKDTVEIKEFRSLRDSLRRQGAEGFSDGKFRIGKFTATIELNRGYGDEVDTQTVEFWIIPWRQLIKYAGILIVALIILRFIGSRVSIKVGRK